MCTTHQRVIIQHEDPAISMDVRSAPPLFSSDIAITRSSRIPGESFSLHGRGKPAWDLPNVPSPEWRAVLTAEENSRLLALLAELVVPYSQPQGAGLDGTWHILEITAGAHTVRFEWWVDVPPGWDRAGALYDFALSVARRTYLESLEGGRR